MTSKLNLSPLTASMKKGSVYINDGSKNIAMITPEIFSEGWAKNVVDDALDAGAYDGMVPFGPIGLKTSLASWPAHLKLRFTLTPVKPVEVIHIRVVVNLPYDHWAGANYQLGQQLGVVPREKPANNKIAEGDSSTLTLGSTGDLQGLRIVMEAPGLHTVLQDNRQWTPLLHAFVTRNEPADKPWAWNAGEEKTYEFSLAFTRPVKIV